MYDFYFGTREEVSQNEDKFLIAAKRMMPRWINSIPDSEFLSLAALLDEQGKAAVKDGRRLVIVETGVGASTLANVYYSIKYGGLALSWDYNAAKGSAIRTVCSETIGNVFGSHVDSYWKLVAHDSLSPQLGLSILPELVDHVDLFFHDSEHTWKAVSRELKLVNPLLSEGAVVALDDANQDYLHTNLAYINTFRKKLGLPAIERTQDNTCPPFYKQTEEFLRANWHDVQILADLYKKTVRQDPYFAYFSSEFDIKAAIGTERLEELEHRFDSWRVRGKR